MTSLWSTWMLASGAGGVNFGFIGDITGQHQSLVMFLCSLLQAVLRVGQLGPHASPLPRTPWHLRGRRRCLQL